MLIFAKDVIYLQKQADKGFMTIADHIIQYALTQNEPFHLSELMQYLESQKVSQSSAKVVLYRLLHRRQLEKVARGLYRLTVMHKTEFQYLPSDDELILARQVREKFPFVDFCIWKPAALIPYMQHIPALSLLFIDVEKDASESVFYFLQGLQTQKKILLNPSQQECERYITSDEMIIVRTLINEAPIVPLCNYFVPTIEKILVDAVGDKELLFAQGAELYTIYENAFQRNNINVSRLLRYAARRNRKDKIMKILNTFEK